MTIFKNIQKFMTIQKVDHTEGGHRLFIVFGIWVYMGFLPDGEMIAGITFPKRQRIYQWANALMERSLQNWAKRRSSVELDLIIRAIGGTLENLAEVAEARDWSYHRENCYRKELMETLALVREEKYRRLTAEAINLA
jgi:hypothetical protein